MLSKWHECPECNKLLPDFTEDPVHKMESIPGTMIGAKNWGLDRSYALGENLQLLLC